MKITNYQLTSRVFYFFAVSVCIAAAAWTSRDPLMLAVGIPGLAAGHFYSWKRRDNISTRRTLLLFFLMLVLTIYLGREMLLYAAADRLVLVRYLIYGLAIGSFDLMRKRNLVASLMLGTMLLILISELALDLWFLAFPVAFTVLAVTAFALGRIETETDRGALIGELKWATAGRTWLGFALSTLLLSSVFLLLMPRLASGQVAQASWLPSRLDLSQAGPALLPSKPSASLSPGILPSRQDGEVSGTGIYATLGYTGSSADRAVMNVRSRISSYWRGAILDEYDGQGWLPSPLQIELFDESRGEFILPDSQPGLTRQRLYWQAYYMLSDQPNAIFTGYNPGRIYLTQAGQIALERGTLYRALSAVPYFRPEPLRNDRVVTNDTVNLKLPPISQRTANLAESIVQGTTTDYDKAVRLERFLLNNYSYELSVEPLPPERDATDYFLFEEQKGYCSHFATSMAVMARHVGLPARVAVGYLPGLIDPMTGAHIVRAGDAHAWVEVHFQRHGWVAFDPTPRPDAAMGFATGRNWLYFGLEDITGVTFASMLSPITGNLSLPRIPSWVWVAVPGIAISVTLLALLLRRRVVTTPKTTSYSTLEGETRKAVLKLYGKMIKLLTGKGLPPRQPYQPPFEYAAAVFRHIPNSQETVEWLSRLASNAAYNPEPPSPAVVTEARSRLASLRRALRSRRI